ncbi:MAG: serine/threonine protein kinase [Bacteroidales bacterium]|nr:serine/threonine protein kinase [Bacteroidales bacterium]
MSENNVSNIHSEDYADIKPLYESHYGNSRVFTAQYNGRKVVIKALKEQYANDSRCRAKLHEEYDMTSLLDNRFIRKVIDFVNIEGLGDCIVLEYIEGKSLAEHVRVGTLSEKQVKSVLIDVCDALSYMHRNQIVHGNLKPENIIITANDSRAKLIDIGVPKTEQDADRELLIKEMAFVAPEIIKGEDYDSRADIYSLGKIMEFFNERNISKQFNAVATHCTQFSKEQRYDSISEVRSAIAKGHPIVKIIIAVAAVVLIALLAAIYIPKIKTNMEKERAERMAKDFEREVSNMQNELPSLCEKYQLKSLNEPINFSWADDSLRYVSSLTPYFSSDEYKSQAMKALESQREAIEESRRADFDKLLVSEFKQATDSVALQLKTALPDPTEDQLLIMAGKWYNQIK